MEHKFRIIKRSRFNEMLDISPPETQDWRRFLLGEAAGYRECGVTKNVRPAYWAFFDLGSGEFAASVSPMTREEFKRTGLREVRGNLVRRFIVQLQERRVYHAFTDIVVDAENEEAAVEKAEALEMDHGNKRYWRLSDIQEYTEPLDPKVEDVDVDAAALTFPETG